MNSKSVLTLWPGREQFLAKPEGERTKGFIVTNMANYANWLFDERMKMRKMTFSATACRFKYETVIYTFVGMESYVLTKVEFVSDGETFSSDSVRLNFRSAEASRLPVMTLTLNQAWRLFGDSLLTLVDGIVDSTKSVEFFASAIANIEFAEKSQAYKSSGIQFGGW